MSAKSSIDSGAGVFVMPVFLDGGEQSLQWLERAVDSIRAQTDPNWRLVMVDDHSPLSGTAAALQRIQGRDRRIHVIQTQTNSGPGVARNTGIEWAHRNGLPFILFLDADDAAHRERVATVRQLMSEDTSIGVVYSTFKVIDEMDKEVPRDKLPGPIQEILECHGDNAPQGELAWVEIGTITGYANLTSSTAVTTPLAMKQPFPAIRAVEDAHTWFRYGAEGKKFVYSPNIPSSYRIPQRAADSAMRDRIGGVDRYYAQQCDVEREGFQLALNTAMSNGGISAEETRRMMTGYHVRMAESMRRANQPKLAQKEIERAYAISQRLAGEWMNFHKYEWAKSYQAIIFDFFDVIRSDPLNGWLRVHGLKRGGATHEASVAFDRGEIDVREFFRRLGVVTGQSAADVEAEFNRHTAVNDELVELIGELAKRYKIGLLSNAGSSFIRAMLTEHDLERLFHHVVISGEVGVVKPEPEIYHHILEQLETTPEQAIFIDDNPKNTEASERVGIRGVQYSDMPALRADLADLGIKLS